MFYNCFGDLCMNKVKLSFCLFLFVISFLYVGDLVKGVNVLDFLLAKDKKTLTISALTNTNFRDPVSVLDVPGGAISKDVDKDYVKDVNGAGKLNKVKEEKEVNESPIIYFFNTHQTEEYASSAYNITPTVKTVSDILKDELGELGISTLVENRSITKEVKRRGLDYTGTYTVSFEYLQERKKENPSLEYFFDMHRDSVTGDASRTIIDGKKYARLMFLVGTKNDNYRYNVKNLKIMEEYLNKYYPGLLRDTYYQKHSAFNQFYSTKMFLVELGGPDNTLEEIYNTSVALSKAIKYYVEVSCEK